MIDNEMKKMELQLEERLYGKQHYRDTQKPGLERVVSVHRDVDGFRVRLLASHFFDSGGYKLKDSAKRELDAVAVLLKELGRQVTVQGHTDSMPARGALGNWEISALRAAEVVRYFIYQHGFAASTLAVAGYADTRPITDNSTEPGRKLNRRMEIKIHYDD